MNGWFVVTLEVLVVVMMAAVVLGVVGTLLVIGKQIIEELRR